MRKPKDYKPLTAADIAELEIEFYPGIAIETPAIEAWVAFSIIQGALDHLARKRSKAAAEARLILCQALSDVLRADIKRENERRRKLLGVPRGTKQLDSAASLE